MTQRTAGSENGDRAGARTQGDDYAERLATLEQARWKQLLDVQRPYRRHLQRLDLGKTLDVGCGIGRNLLALPPGSIGVDHNASSVALARRRGLDARTPQQLLGSPEAAPGHFDSALFAHVLEHVAQDVADELLQRYLRCVRPGGKVVLICPQERGYRSDRTHIRFVDERALADHARRAGLAVHRQYSFPFPRPVGRVFPYNEFVLLATRPADAAPSPS